jgi:hypothetical protein
MVLPHTGSAIGQFTKARLGRRPPVREFAQESSDPAPATSGPDKQQV